MDGSAIIKSGHDGTTLEGLIETPAICAFVADSPSNSPDFEKPRFQATGQESSDNIQPLYFSPTRRLSNPTQIALTSVREARTIPNWNIIR